MATSLSYVTLLLSTHVENPDIQVWFACRVLDIVLAGTLIKVRRAYLRCSSSFFNVSHSWLALLLREAEPVWIYVIRLMGRRDLYVAQYIAVEHSERGRS